MRRGKLIKAERNEKEGVKVKKCRGRIESNRTKLKGLRWKD